MCVIREGFRKQLIPESALDVMLSSISKSTLAQYSSSLKQWWEYCYQHRINFYNFSISSLIDFLSNCFHKGSSYGTLNSHRSAISLISTNNISDNTHLKRFFKGIFKLKPVFPRYNMTWDPNTVLNYLDNLNNDQINLEVLSKKVVMLLALATGQRTQTLSLLKLSNTKMFNDRIIITITNLIKTSAIGRSQPTVNLPFFNQRPGICPASVLQKYLTLTASIRSSEDHIILTVKKPFRAASSQTIGRWLKQTLCDSGIDTTVFSAHSTRHASTSAASRAGLNVDIIRKCAGWSAQSTVFATFYSRPIIDSNINLLSSIS